MAKKVTRDSPIIKRPAKEPDQLEDQMIALAMMRAKEKLEDGTASSQLICHFLKMGSTSEHLKKENLRLENELLQAKTDLIRSEKESTKFYQEVIGAFQSYSPPDHSEVENDPNI